MPFPIRTAVPSLALLLTSCVAYEQRALNAPNLLAEQDRVAVSAFERVRGESSAPQAPPDGAPITLRVLDAAAFAVVHEPTLGARRAELGIARAELVEAGLLPNPTISFDAMDAVAAAAITGSATTENFVSGLGLSWQLPRPGEIDAKEAAAGARVKEATAEVRVAEWRLVRAVFADFVDLAGVERQIELVERLRESTNRTAAFVASLRRSGGATALQESLASLEVLRLEEESKRLAGDRRAARQRLNAAMGLPPEIPWTPLIEDDLLSATPPDESIEEAVGRALNRRPDLAAIAAAYERAESELRLEIARQFPSLEIGTGFALELPIATGFNASAIRTAEAKRAKLEREMASAVFETRAEIYAARARYERSRDQLEVIESRLRPRLDENLRLLEESLRLGGVTVFEIVAAQQQLIDSERRALDVRIERARARVDLETITGNLPSLLPLPPIEGDPSIGDRTHEEKRR